MSFINLAEYLVAELNDRKLKNPRFSLRAWSKQMGYRNPSLLSDVISGRRRPTEDLLVRLSSNLKLDEKKQSLLMELASRSIEGKSKSKGSKASLGKRPKNQILAVDNFRMISDWYHLTILELFLLKDFDGSPKTAVKMLMRNLPKAFVEGAFARLTRLGLLQENRDGSYARAEKAAGLFIGSEIKEAAIRNHHQQMIDLARDALIEQDTKTRDFSGSTVGIRKEHLPEIKEAIYNLHALINSFSAESGTGEAVYQLNIQLFRLDKENKGKDPSHD